MQGRATPMVGNRTLEPFEQLAIRSAGSTPETVCARDGRRPAKLVSFRDVYEGGGQFRTILLAKAEDIRGGRVIRFTPPNLIEQELTKVFDELANEHFLEGLQRREVAQNVAALLSDINRIHPFREGNATAVRASIGRQLGVQTSFRGGQQGAPHPDQYSVRKRGFGDDGAATGRNHGHRAHSIAGKSDRSS